MPWDPNRTASWAPGDWIFNPILGRRAQISTISRRLSFDTIRTVDGRHLVDEVIDHWDLELPQLIFPNSTWQDRRNQ